MQLPEEGLMLGAYYGTQRGFYEADLVQASPKVIRIDHIELKVLMLFKVVVEDEAFLKIRVKVVLHDFSLVKLHPAIPRVIACVDYHLRITHTYYVDILQVATRDEELHLT